MTGETLEQWAERVAPTLTARQWLFVGHDAALREKADANAGSWSLADLTVAEARALLAYRDKVARSLTEPQRRWLGHFVDGGGYGLRGGAVALRSLEKLRLAEPEARCPTCGSITHYAVVVHPFGREVARVLEE